MLESPPPDPPNGMIVPFSHPQRLRYRTFLSRWVVLLALLAGGGNFRNFVVAQPPTQPSTEAGKVSEENIRRLVDKLRSGHFAQRELACEQLYEIGHVALPVLRASRRTSSDAEQNDRLDRIIESLAEQDLESRIRTFLKGGEAELENWPELEKWFGDSPRVRELFVDLYREHPYLVASLGGTVQQRSIGLARVRRRLIERGIGTRESPQRFDLIALLLPLADPDFKAGSQYDMIVASLLQLYPTSDFRNDAVFGEPFLRMVTQWMLGSDPSVREQVLRLALQWKMDVGLTLALETISQNPDPILLCRCMQTISRQGNREHLNLLARHLNDPTVVYRRRYRNIQGGDVQVGDVAAAAIAFLSSVPVTEIGFAEPAEHEIFGIIYEELVIPSKQRDDETLEQESAEAGGNPAQEPAPIELRPTEQRPIQQGPFGPRPQSFEELQKLHLQAQRQAEARAEIRLKAMELVPGPVSVPAVPTPAVPAPAVPAPAEKS